MTTLAELQASARAFMESRIYLTALELDLFAAVGDGAAAATVAERLGASPRAMAMLLNALAGLGVLVKQNGRFRCTAAARELGAARPGLLHLISQWRAWDTLTDCVRTGTRVNPDRLAGQDPAWTENFIQAMQLRARTEAPALVAQVGAGGVRRLLDVGGGPGSYALAFAAANPDLHADLLDIAAVVPLAQANILAAGLEGRVATRTGDLRQDPLGQDYDLILLSAVCHILDEPGNQDLLHRCAQALAPGGRLVIRDFLLDEDRAGPKAAAVFALNMLVATDHGNTYTEGDYRAWLAQAGLTAVTRIKGEDLLVARKGAAQ